MLKTRKEAIAAGEKFYFTGEPCKHGHICKRYSEGGCIKCKEITENSDRRKKYEQSKNRKERRKAWRHGYMKEYRLKLENKERKNKWSRERRKTHPEFKLRDNISSSIRQSLDKNKNGHSWESLVDFTLNELKIHLESLWEPWMNWENHGRYNKNKKTWHIDHIKPLSLCLSFDEAWQLNNLQPLDAFQNCVKGNRYIG